MHFFTVVSRATIGTTGIGKIVRNRERMIVLSPLIFHTIYEEPLDKLFYNNRDNQCRWNSWK